MISSFFSGRLSSSNPDDNRFNDVNLWPQILQNNEALFSAEEKKIIASLLRDGQHHLFDNWDELGINDERKHFMLGQITLFNQELPGGLSSYISRAKKLLLSSKNDENPLKGWRPEVPKGIQVSPFDEEYLKYEQLGLDRLALCGFVLVAGGLGERLGYSGIKVELPVEMVTRTTYLELYCKQIVAIQNLCRNKHRQENNNIIVKTDQIDENGSPVSSPSPSIKSEKELKFDEIYPQSMTTKNSSNATGNPLQHDLSLIPLVIMVSDDTEDQTIELLEQNNYFGLKKPQVTLLKQQKVPALIDVHAHLALVEGDPYKIDAKPHGHGDIHSLMHISGTAKRWYKAGVEWVVFFQDTNGLAFNALSTMLGVSIKHNLDVNTLTVPRKAKQSMGAITQLVQTESFLGGGKSMTINVEYNQLDPLLRASGQYPNGDVNDPVTNLSPFPGNTNQLLFAMESYFLHLEHSGGSMPEFVNPKYVDGNRNIFKKPTRLECMMQDYPKILKSSSKVGFTLLPSWFCYSPCKNNSNDAVVAAAIGIPPSCAYTAETDQYNCHAQILRLIGVQCPPATPKSYLNITCVPGPQIVLLPSFGIFPSILKSKFVHPERVEITQRSTLVIEGDVEIHSLRLDGALKLIAIPGTKLIVNAGDHDDLCATSEQRYSSKIISNAGYIYKEIDVGRKEVIDHQRVQKSKNKDKILLNEIDFIRGYVLEQVAIQVISTEDGPKPPNIIDNLFMNSNSNVSNDIISPLAVNSSGASSPPRRASLGNNNVSNHRRSVSIRPFAPPDRIIEYVWTGTKLLLKDAYDALGEDELLHDDKNETNNDCYCSFLNFFC